MKKTILYYSSIALLFTVACNNSSTQSASGEDAKTDSVLNKQCYMAVFEKDTAFMNLETYASGKVTGNMDVNYSASPSNNGTMQGKFSGDTLFVDYTFTTGTYEKVNKNPMAFLKEGEQLIVGIGVIETSLGKSYFVKDKPINFDKGRFKFNPIDCK